MIKSQDFASTYVGTPFYMSPEICAAEKYTLKSDIWSLGCIMYELCAREPPFNAKTHYQLVQKIKEGKVPTLPEMYSPELNQVIRSCLKVNPDRRPDTAQLLELPVVKLMRKEKEVVDLNKSLRAKENALRKKEKDLNERLSRLERERESMREEIDSSLRREWEVKARLEIDRLANNEIERLQKQFDEELRMRVEAEVQRHKAAALAAGQHNDNVNHAAALDKTETSAPFVAPAAASGGGHCQEASASASAPVPAPVPAPGSAAAAAAAAAAISTDLLDFAIASPDASKEPRRVARTPFNRAQTMFAGQGHAGTPMDIEMASPSPMAIASLSLSPRRNGSTKPPSTYSGNIFALNADRVSAADSRWDLRDALALESDDEDVVPSPTRNVRSAKNPFTCQNRPVLTSQESCPANRLRPQSTNTGLVSKASSSCSSSSSKTSSKASSKASSQASSKTGLVSKATSSAAATAAEARSRPRSRSPLRQVSKIPSMTGASSDSNGAGPVRKQCAKKEHCSSDTVGRMTAKNVRGRTLVELQQARAGGRPLSACGSSVENASPKRVAFKERMAAGPRRDSVGGSSTSTSTSNTSSNSGSSNGSNSSSSSSSSSTNISRHSRRSSSSAGSGRNEPIAVWDPDRDEMPSPFLVKQKRTSKT
ncbi:hypothetical protein E4U53_008062 [Claviceps sorghi]|nr:hypothetical protein E4U53_008062 [Claviceps sorghi]